MKKNIVTDFCLRWSCVFGLVLALAYVVSGLAMHFAVLRVLWKWL